MVATPAAPGRLDACGAFIAIERTALRAADRAVRTIVHLADTFLTDSVLIENPVYGIVSD